MEAKFLTERQLCSRCLATQKVAIDRLWLKEVMGKQPRTAWWGAQCSQGCGRASVARAHGWGRLQGQLPQGASSSGGDNERLCSKPGMSLMRTSHPCSQRSRWWASAWWDAGGRMQVQPQASFPAASLPPQVPNWRPPSPSKSMRPW